MKNINKYRVIKSIYVDGLGEFSKGQEAQLSEDEAAKFPDGFIEQKQPYIQSFTDETRAIEFDALDEYDAYEADEHE